MSADLKGGGVELTIDSHGVGTITFGHPASNSLPGAVLDALARTIDEASSLADCNVIVLKSWGDRAFCAGASFDELIAIQNEDEGLAFFSGFSKVILAMRRSPKFIICRVQGKTVGGGVGIAAAADYALATSFSASSYPNSLSALGPLLWVLPLNARWAPQLSQPWPSTRQPGTTPNGRKNKDSMLRYSMTLRPWTKPLMRWRNDWQLPTRKPWRN